MVLWITNPKFWTIGLSLGTMVGALIWNAAYFSMADSMLSRDLAGLFNVLGLFCACKWVSDNVGCPDNDEFPKTASAGLTFSAAMSLCVPALYEMFVHPALYGAGMLAVCAVKGAC